MVAGPAATATDSSIGGNNGTSGFPGKGQLVDGKSGFVITAGAVGSSPQSSWRERCLPSPFSPFVPFSFPLQITQSLAPASNGFFFLSPHPPPDPNIHCNLI